MAYCLNLLPAILVPRLCVTMVSAYIATSAYVCSRQIKIHVYEQTESIT